MKTKMNPSQDGQYESKCGSTCKQWSRWKWWWINSSDVCIIENVLAVYKKPSVYKHGARSGWLYLAVSDNSLVIM